MRSLAAAIASDSRPGSGTRGQAIPPASLASMLAKTTEQPTVILKRPANGTERPSTYGINGVVNFAMAADDLAAVPPAIERDLMPDSSRGRGISVDPLIAIKQWANAWSAGNTRAYL